MQSSNTHTDTLVKGLCDPTQSGQVIFRQALKAMSEPGTLLDIEQSNGVGGLNPAMFALLLSLMDQQTSLWLSPELNQANIIKNLQFHTGVKLTNKQSSTMFAVANSHEIDNFSTFDQGSDESPEMSCSVFIQVASITSYANELQVDDSNISNDQTLLTLSGPGILSKKHVLISDLSTALLDFLVERPASFPKGLDFYFASDSTLVCIPRTTIVEAFHKGKKYREQTPCM